MFPFFILEYIVDIKEEDLLHIDNINKALEAARWSGMGADQIVAFYRMFVWLGKFQDAAKKEVEAAKIAANMKIVKQEVKSPIIDLKPKEQPAQAKPVKNKKTKSE